MKEHGAMWQDEAEHTDDAGIDGVMDGPAAPTVVETLKQADVSVSDNGDDSDDSDDSDNETDTAALRGLLLARKQAGLTQAQVAARMGTTTSAVSRLEASLMRGTHSPSFATLCKYAAACGRRVSISFS